MKNVLTCLFAFVFTSHLFAQDPLFTQKTGNINHFNPALVGTQSDFGVQANYRNQWPNSLSIQTLSILTNYNLNNKTGVALEAFVDRNGATQFNKLKLNLNRRAKLGTLDLAYGASLGYNNHNIRVLSLSSRDPNDPRLQRLGSGNYFSFDVGLAAFYKGFILSASTMQANKPQYEILGGTANRKPRYVGTLGYLKEFDQLALAGLATFQHQNKSSVLETQAFAQYEFVKLGLGYHQVLGEFNNPDYFSATLGVQFDTFSIGYSYDDNALNTPNSSIARGTHQATAAWYIKGLNKKKGMSRLMNVLM